MRARDRLAAVPSVAELIEVLAQGERWLAVNKPPRLSVHESNYTGPREQTLLRCLREQLGEKLHAIHRLDTATSGVLLLARDPAMAAELSQQFESRQVRKAYLGVVRGYAPDDSLVDHPLAGAEGKGPLREARTVVRRIAAVEFPWAIGAFPTARYSLVVTWPETGRYHQIRRHLKHLSHPLIGDVNYGRGEHNRAFRMQLAIHRLLLHAWRLHFTDPESGQPQAVVAPWDSEFQRIIERMTPVDWEAAAAEPDPAATRGDAVAADSEPTLR